MKGKADVGLIGLGVMGKNLVLNINDHGYSIAVFNRTTSKVDSFLNDEAKGRKTIIGTHSLKEFVSTLVSPKKLVLMVKAGEIVDLLIEQLIPLFDKGDVIIDCGNSYYPDTTRRTKYLKEKGILFIGAGVSGGEEGARRGPSIMPGGTPEAWPLVKDILQDISAKVEDGATCCEWVGEEGAGHFVKMVHNGIEYGDMQMICEVYDVFRVGLNLSYDKMHDIFTEWNKGELDSYLIEITSDILQKKDTDGTPLVTKILDRAGQKGTGKWTGMSSLDMAVPMTLIMEAVNARSLSALKDERIFASKLFPGPDPLIKDNCEVVVEDLRKALYASKIISYAQGYMLIVKAAKEYGWKLNYGGIALMWRGGCIIRSVFLNKIKEAYDRNPELSNLLVDPYFCKVVNDCQGALRRTVSRAVFSGISLPAMSAALSFFDGYRNANLPANLLQAQRDYFGAHTYERIDKPQGEFFHTDWTGTGDTAFSSDK